MITVPQMNRMMAEDVNIPALRNPASHLPAQRVRRPAAHGMHPGWIDAVRAARLGNERRF